jgi:hypothetical protein
LRLLAKSWLPFAIGWTVLVLSAFVALRFLIPPFSDWSAGDQTQLFQAMIGLAGFGAGLVVLVSAVEQLERMTARPELNIYVARLGADRTSEASALLRFMLEIENVGGAVCRDWQVALTGTGNFMQGGPGAEWKELGDNTLIYNSSAQPLFPRSPLPLPGAVMSISPPEGIGAAAFVWKGEIRYVIATEHDQDRERVPIPIEVEVPQHGGNISIYSRGR